MKTLLNLLLILTLVTSCSTDDSARQTPTTNLDIPSEFQGDWTGQDYGRTLHIEQHSISMTLPDATLEVIEAVQMAYLPNQENNLGIQNNQFLAFEMFSLNGMLVTLSTDDGTIIYQDFYGRD